MAVPAALPNLPPGAFQGIKPSNPDRVICQPMTALDKAPNPAGMGKKQGSGAV